MPLLGALDEPLALAESGDAVGWMIEIPILQALAPQDKGQVGRALVPLERE